MWIVEYNCCLRTLPELLALRQRKTVFFVPYFFIDYPTLNISHLITFTKFVTPRTVLHVSLCKCLTTEEAVIKPLINFPENTASLFLLSLPYNHDAF